ncbi:MAG: hypothetical protein EOM37_00660 [Proteobacteria bacterium]|jgi:cell division transport system permease protein|nr:hypothetical protein [Alphaproteobacteria bacterium]NCC02551.1 hypothetical protein [Pseudomonadota bacterium]
MSIPNNLFATAFHEQRLGMMFVILMTVLVYLGSLAMAAQAALGRTSVAWGDELQTRMTLELPFLNGEGQAERQKMADKLLQELSTNPDIASVKQISDEEKQRLLESWVSDDELLRSLPLPVLIDVQLKGAVQSGADRVKERLSLPYQKVKVYSHAGWMNTLMGFLNVLGYLSIIMIILTFFTLVTVVAVIARAVTAVQKDTIELMHFIGASDNLIAVQFQNHIQRLSLPASVAGFGLAGLTLIVIILILNTSGGLSVVAPMSWVTIVFVMTLVPLCATALSVVSARLLALKQLKQFL